MADVTARERADAIIAKHGNEVRGLAKTAEPEEVTNFLRHLRDDIENAINAMPIEDDEPASRKRNTAHMPATGHDKLAASARK